MVPDGDFERRIQALLDGHPLNPSPDRGQSPELADPLFVIDAIARVSRTAIFGREDSPDPSVSRQWGHLEIRSEIGRGASGTVYRAWDSRLAREVALKLLPSDSGADVDALEEGRLLARLNHPHIVRVFGADTHDGIAGVWMELLEGDTLDTVRARDGAAGVEEVLLIGIDLARATSAVHGAGLLHRDIKGRNILREWGGRVVLMDLGAGRSAAPGNGGSDGTGTPLYMAPEIIAGGPATIQSDLYSLGVVLFRLLAGVFPVAADDLTSLRAAHARGSRTALSVLRPDVGNAAAAVVERACNPVPGEPVSERCRVRGGARRSARGHAFSTYADSIARRAPSRRLGSYCSGRCLDRCGAFDCARDDMEHESGQGGPARIRPGRASS